MSADSFTIYDATNLGKRVCGSCTACCKLLPVRALDKPGWTRCKFQRVHKGCTVYQGRQMPTECQVWSCRWLTGQDTEGMRRPDRSHYVIDVMPDMITTVEGQDSHDRMVMQVWLDPAFPDAHRDPALRAWIERRAQEDGMATVVRAGVDKIILVVAPCLAADRQWHEQVVMPRTGGTGNRFVDKLKTMAGARP